MIYCPGESRILSLFHRKKGFRLPHNPLKDVKEEVAAGDKSRKLALYQALHINFNLLGIRALAAQLTRNQNSELDNR